MMQTSPFQFVNTARRRGVTLVELMVVLTIVALLASALIFALSAAQEAARVAKTKTMIATMDTLMMEYWEGFESRRAPTKVHDSSSPKSIAQLRLVAMRKLFQMEVPDRWTDTKVATTGELLTTMAAMTRWGFNAQRKHPQAQANQGAELLYVIISYITGGEGAREYFSEGDIGDTDGDGALEFLDGWGRPIAFLRWPAGFISSRITGDAVNDHDPYDPLLLETGAYRLVPLIYSAGPDGDFDILSNSPGGFQFPTTSSGWLNPYAIVIKVGSREIKMGTAYDTDDDGIEEWHDNIHNHDLERN